MEHAISRKPKERQLMTGKSGIRIGRAVKDSLIYRRPSWLLYSHVSNGVCFAAVMRSSFSSASRPRAPTPTHLHNAAPSNNRRENASRVSRGFRGDEYALYFMQTNTYNALGTYLHEWETEVSRYRTLNARVSLKRPARVCELHFSHANDAQANLPSNNDMP